MHVPIALAGIFAAYIAYWALSSVYTSFRNARRARQLKCKEPPMLKNKYPLGIDLVMRALAADKAQLFLSEVTKRLDEAGAPTYKYSALGAIQIHTTDPKNVQAILATQFSDFDLGSARRGNFFPLLGDGIFSQDGKSWEHSRAMMRPQFARDQISDLELEEKHVQTMMTALDRHLSSDGWIQRVDLQVLFFRLTLDTATEFLFGESVNSQAREMDGNNPTGKTGFAWSFDFAQKVLATRARFQELYWLYYPLSFAQANKVCHDFINRFVRLALTLQYREKELERGANGKEKYVFLEALAAQTQDPAVLRDQTLHILLAGRDTTASLLGWLWYELARDTTRYQKLRKIIIREFGTYEKPAGITFATLKNCHYLQYCLNEALRAHPVVPINSRRANKDTTIPRGGGPDGMSPVFVPKNTQVDYSVYAMHRRKDIWGPDAEEFNPERWEGRRVGWEYLPFNGGPRICIGQQFALTEAGYVTVRMLQRFDKLENLDPEKITTYNLGLTACSGTGVQVRLHISS